MKAADDESGFGPEDSGPIEWRLKPTILTERIAVIVGDYDNNDRDT